MKMMEIPLNLVKKIIGRISTEMEPIFYELSSIS